MILVVDDDPNLLDVLRAVLSGAGYPVETVSSADEALESLESLEPELIISDVRMPGRDGFSFKREVSRRFPNRLTPFLFLSSQDDASSVVRGLDLGAEDYLIKPIHPEILKAKVRSVLAKAQRLHVAVFEGDIAHFPFLQVLQFCEARGLSGQIQVTAQGAPDAGPELDVTIRLERGEVVFDEVADEHLDTLMGLAEGTFRIQVPQVDFHEIQHASLVRPVPEAELRSGEGLEAFSKALPIDGRPMGILSGVRLAGRLFQVQTEYVTSAGGAAAPVAGSAGVGRSADPPGPGNRTGGGQIVTVVLLDGRTVIKRTRSAGEERGRDGVTQEMREQHAAVEAEVRDKLQSLVSRSGDAPAGPAPARDTASPSDENLQAEFNRLFEAGVDAYVAGQYAEAITFWERSADIDPENKTVAVNLDIARKKLTSGKH